jgi:hypothetical protein
MMEKTISSNWGWKGLVEVGGLLLFSLSVVIAFNGIAQIPLPIYAIVALLLFFLLAFPYRVEVTQQQVVVKQVIRTYRKSLTKVRRIYLAPNFYGDPYLVLQTDQGGVFPQIHRFTNYSALAKALIEAAYIANPTVQLDPSVIKKFGLPPYGVFDT